ncbi:AAA-like domain-containing protein [Nostoc sp. UHCC 0251]|uniref:AAA-like domain-containing protein n=1 Tax=Nostoc sp. UHCC 0251 TaxID=3110240 RepID=UPI002B1FAB6A|nr:AAA-like domain-containing protein [Nostoc sp. UHCC 0251]MEA5622602.1 AAA-like domain-containing protein [Nostoc sp. UHCC 0251]
MLTLPAPSQSARFFISYRSQDPDLSLAKDFYEAIKAAGHEAFMAGESIRLGEKWPQRIDEELKLCDYFLLLLSERSATSEMVTEEVRQAKELRDSSDRHKPVILPIRVNLPWSTPLNYDLRGYLQQIQQREWKSAADTHRILQEIFSLVAIGDVERLAEWESGELGDEKLFSPIASSAYPLLPVTEPVFPDGQVNLAENSSDLNGLLDPELSPELEFPFFDQVFYSNCYKEVKKPGALIRVKAPLQWGKTYLINQILDYGIQQGYQVVRIDFQEPEKEIFNTLERFLHWFCGSIAEELNLPHNLAENWRGALSANSNCTNYFERYLLPAISSSLILGLDNVDILFSHQAIACDFLPLLRTWHEKAHTRPIWKKLQLVIAYSKEDYISTDRNKSPFNVGKSIDIPQLNQAQVQKLAQHLKLHWNEEQTTQLMDMVGGHPWLVKKALHEMTRCGLTLIELLQIAPTEGGLYGDHLRLHWLILQEHQLLEIMKQVVATNTAVLIDRVKASKLQHMGLVKYTHNNSVQPLCDLYRLYFRDRLGM